MGPLELLTRALSSRVPRAPHRAILPEYTLVRSPPGQVGEAQVAGSFRLGSLKPQ